MASNDNIECSLVSELDIYQDEALAESILETDIIVSSVEPIETIPRIEVEIGVTQWSLVSDAIFIKNITGEEPQWFTDIIDEAIRTNPDLIAEFDDLQTQINTLDDGYTNLVSITDSHTSQLVVLKVSSEENTSAIVRLDDVKITEDQASAISSETVTAWMNGGESAAWFNRHVQAVATNTSANTTSILTLGGEVDGVESSVTTIEQALVDKYQNPEWTREDPPTDPDSFGEPQWLYTARAKHSLEVNANGSISGFIADAVSGPEGAKSSFKIYADEFLICDKTDSAGQPGTIAFLIKFPGSGADPQIMLNGDVYFGDIPGYENIEYTLFDIATDGIVDPIEKLALEKSYQDLIKRDSALFELVYDGGARYSDLISTYPIDTSEYTNSYNVVVGLMDSLGINTVYPSPAPADKYSPTLLTDISQTRDTFNDIFAEYNDRYNKLNELIQNLVKQVADDSYNIMVNILEDNIITVAEKSSIRDYIDQIEIKYNEIKAGLTPPDPIYGDCGYAEFSRERLEYIAFVEYENSLYAVKGDPITRPCETDPSGEVFPIDGLVVRVHDEPAYDIYNADCLLDPIGAECVDFVVDDLEAQKLLASTRWFVDSRAAFHSAQAGGAIDIQYLRVGELGDTNPHTLIIDDEIQTGIIGVSTHFGDETTVYPAENHVNFKDGGMFNSNVYGEDLPGTPSFIVDGYASGLWNGVCNADNKPNFRGRLIEATTGSFSKLYTGEIVSLASGKYRTKNFLIKNISAEVTLHELGNEDYTVGSERFYSPTYSVNTPAINNNRIRSFSASMFTVSLNGAFTESKNDGDLIMMLLNLEYSTDGSGHWFPVVNQIFDTSNNQTFSFEPMTCINFVDFRVRIRYSSNGYFMKRKNIIANIVLKN